MNDTLHADLAKHCMELEQRLSEANARIAMMAEALKESIDCLHDVATDKSGWAWEEVILQSQEALSTSPESLKKWEAEKLFPLQRQIAMLHDALQYEADWHTTIVSDIGGKYKPFCSTVDALSNTKATAEAYDREHAAKVLEDFIKTLRALPSIGLSERQFGELKLAAELRASNKKGGE